jgi:hypothetical protein
MSRSFAQEYIYQRGNKSLEITEENLFPFVEGLLNVVEQDYIKHSKKRNNNKVNVINLTVDYDYDDSADTLSTYMINPRNYKVAIKLDNDTYLHFDEEYKPFELKILNASIVLDIDKINLNKIMNIKGNILISINEIKVNCKIVTFSHNADKLVHIHSVIANNINVPPVSLELAKV